MNCENTTAFTSRSVHPCIRASVHPCIRASVHPCMGACVYARMFTHTTARACLHGRTGRACVVQHCEHLNEFGANRSLRVDICTDMRMDMCADMSIDMCMDMCIDMCIDMCVDMSLALITAGRSMMPSSPASWSSPSLDA